MATSKTTKRHKLQTKAKQLQDQIRNETLNKSFQ